jgi:hypothetical protein
VSQVPLRAPGKLDAVHAQEFKALQRFTCADSETVHALFNQALARIAPQ